MLRALVIAAVAALLGMSGVAPGFALADSGPAAAAQQGVAAAAMPEEQVLTVIRELFPGAEANRAIAVARCESGLRTDAIGGPNSDGSRDYGLFQFNDGGTIQGIFPRIGYDGTLSQQIKWALDGRINTEAARELWRQRSWQPWWCAHKLGIMAGGWSYERGPNWDRFDEDGRLIADSTPAPQPAPQPETAPAPTPVEPPSVTWTATLGELGASHQVLQIAVSPAGNWVVEIERYEDGAWRAAGTHTTSGAEVLETIVPPGRYRALVPAQAGRPEARPAHELVLLSQSTA